MRAVNLIPPEQRRGAGGIAGRSGGVVYVLAGVLAAVVLLGVVYALAVHDVASKKSQLATVTQQVNSVNAQAQALEPYVQFATAANSDAAQVKTLAQQRFDWPSAMQQLALALPSDVTFTSFAATSAIGSASDTGSSTAPVPTPGSGASFTINGCASTQGEIATVLENLSSVPGVTDVSLVSSAENVRPKKQHYGKAAYAVSGSCPYVMFTLGLSYGESYIVPNGNAGSSTAQTVGSGSSPSGSTPIKTAASQQSTGVTQ